MSETPAGLEGGGVRAVIGAAAWTTGVVIASPSPLEARWAMALLLFVPLVLLPLVLDLVTADGRNGPAASRALRAVALLQLPAALCLGAASILARGPVAGALALPWLATTALIALAGLLRLAKRGPRTADGLCTDVGLVYVVVGGAWAAGDRMGRRPLEFDEIIVLLTAIHFHYAGFVLPIVTGLASRRVGGVVATVASIAVVAGVPLVAVGITATRLGADPMLETNAAWIMAAGGTLAAWLHLRAAMRPGPSRAVRGLWLVAAAALFASMVLAALYGSRFMIPIKWLDIPLMRALHGTANALGFGLAGVIGWRLAGRVSGG